jgi:hypothetical protein
LDSVYSLELAPFHQQAKRFAVAAMHAVRASDAHESTTGLKGLARRTSGLLSGMGIHPASLLRRTCRPNELYYVVRGEDMSALVAGIPDPSGTL